MTIHESAGLSLPRTGNSKADVLERMRQARDQDLKWHDGRAFSLVYFASDEITELLKDASLLFFSENGLNPTAFPSLKKFENEVVAMTASLLGGDAATVGSLTSGGTESILVAVLAAREWSSVKRPEIHAPAVVVPSSAHPAFDKAAHYFGVKVIRVPVGANYRADPAAMEKAITPETVMLVGSAPAYPHGLVDPIAELAEIARQRQLLMHVDACVGGWILPFARRLGHPVPDFDFSLPGVTSISADLHKYGYAAKGASVVLFRTPELRRSAFFASTDWSGGVYASPTLAGTRPGGPIAAAWAVMNFLGEEGYLTLTRDLMRTTLKVQAGIRRIRGLYIIGEPEVSVMAIASDQYNIYDVGDELSALGWQLDRQQFPPSLHLTLSPYHARVADQFLEDLEKAVARVRRPNLRRSASAAIVSVANTLARLLPAPLVSRLTERASSQMGSGSAGLSQNTAALYGLIGSLPNRSDLKELVLDLIDQMSRITP